MSRLGGRKAVLAVCIPGRAPYAVLEKHFKRPRGKVDLAGTGLPALVSITDPNDIEILWDEVPSIGDQVSQRMSDAFQQQEDRMQQAAEVQRQMLQDAQGVAGTTPCDPPSSAGVEMLAENAKQTLAYVRDPAMRRMLIAQYRAAGVHIDEEEDA
jgi:hypothetical protein